MLKDAHAFHIYIYNTVVLPYVMFTWISYAWCILYNLLELELCS